MKGEFTEEPQDELQRAADEAMGVLKARFGEDFSCVISLMVGRRGTTALWFPGEEEGDFAVLAFEQQLVHTMASAKALGIQIEIIKPDLN